MTPAALPWDAPFVPDADEIRRTPTGWLPPRDSSELVVERPDGTWEVKF